MNEDLEFKDIDEDDEEEDDDEKENLIFSNFQNMQKTAFQCLISLR